MWYALGQIRGSTGKTLGERRLEAVEFEIGTKVSDYLQEDIKDKSSPYHTGTSWPISPFPHF